ncbi:MAG: hypothetical protein ACI9BV_002919, partial [Rhodothermales bacterium]
MDSPRSDNGGKQAQKWNTGNFSTSIVRGHRGSSVIN